MFQILLNLKIWKAERKQRLKEREDEKKRLKQLEDEEGSFTMIYNDLKINMHCIISIF